MIHNTIWHQESIFPGWALGLFSSIGKIWVPWNAKLICCPQRPLPHFADMYWRPREEWRLLSLDHLRRRGRNRSTKPWSESKSHWAFHSPGFRGTSKWSKREFKLGWSFSSGRFPWSFFLSLPMFWFLAEEIACPSPDPDSLLINSIPEAEMWTLRPHSYFPIQCFSMWAEGASDGCVRYLASTWVVKQLVWFSLELLLYPIWSEYKSFYVLMVFKNQCCNTLFPWEFKASFGALKLRISELRYLWLQIYIF
jgi:hypothetical protein